MQKEYLKAFDEIQETLSAFYTKYATDKNVTYAEAQKQLNAFDFASYGSRMETLKRRAVATNNPFVIAEMQRLYQSASVNRFNALLSEIDAKVLLLGYSQQLTMEEILSETFENTLYSTAYTMAIGTGVGVSFAKIDHSAVELAIKYPWSGAMFSDLIWDNKVKLTKEMKSTITNGLIKGSSVQRMSRQLSGNMDSSYKDSLRLIRTETAYVVTEATAQGYEKLELDSFVFLGTLDSKTSKTCQSLDGKIFKLKDKQVGVNCPPMHPNCRSAISPYFPDIELRERRARDVQGNSFIVPNMNYEEWASKYLK
ncbi:hypothetical protein FQ085_06525 [Planococcus sp. ANT_H30]|uniref:minor capsid protein n=1 Tax=Planococcus sp. ANT_H30 TaxID=2597347 RepID=UPI0011EF559D|nr:minor capsid protein [Planococcus sp. ANT_H30]KAA0957701.1 hypothetical protein FQ085_06525 [Planococcus sp. ANT_H30]